MYLIIDENINCSSDERVFSTSGPLREVAQLFVPTPLTGEAWCTVIGVKEGEIFIPAQAVQVEDSGAGNAWLIYGGEWGLRFQPKESTSPWSLKDQNQWGVPFKVLDISGAEIRFK